MGFKEEPPRPPDHGPDDRQFDLGFDVTAMLPYLNRNSLLSVPGGASTSVVDIEELIVAAKDELRKAQYTEKMAAKDKAQLAGQMLESGTTEGTGFADRLAAVMKEAGVQLPRLTVEYCNLSVEADALVGSGSTPSLGNAFKDLLQRAACQGGLKTANFKILKNMNGVLRPGTTTLLLGPPGSGKSVFMQALSGRLQSSAKIRVSGSVKYNGKESSEFVLRRTAAYVDQIDYHIPNLTVLETCQFAFNCLHNMEDAAWLLAEFKQMEERFERDLSLEEMEHAAEEGKAGHKGNMQSAPADMEFVTAMRTLVKQRAKPFVILKVLGLSEVADTVVGDSMTRGISGGQRKRVTTGEVLCGPQSLVLMDEISTGLDSATTYSVVQSFVNTSHALRKTFLISLLQPAPEVVSLFDHILLLTDGHVIYHGPVEGILPFFECQLDFVCPEVTTPVGQYAYASSALLERKELTERDRNPIKLISMPPKTLLIPVEEMEGAFWKQTEAGKAMLDQLDNHPFDPEAGPPGSLATTHYASSYMHLAKLVFLRQVLLNKREKAFYIARAAQAAILTLIIGSMYTGLDATSEGARQVMSLSSLSVMNMAMFSMPQIGIVFANKRVFYKQRDNNFFPPAAYVFSFVLTQIPQSAVECIIYSLGVYWISGLTRTASNYFLFLVVIFSISNAMAAFYRLVAFIVPSMVVANAGGGVMLLFLMITNGFSIVRASIPMYLIWVYWMNPMAWALRALVADELGTSTWDTPAGNGQTIGEASADAFGFYLGVKWIWAAVGYCWFWLLLCSGLGVLALNVTNPPSPRPTVAEEDQKEEIRRGLLATLQKTAGQTAMLASQTMKKVGSFAAAPAADKLHTASSVAGIVQEKAVVPFVPITLVCRNVRYYVNDPSRGTAPGVVKDSSDKEISGKLELLKGLDIWAEPGYLTALMGGSGAGKTTLMDCILGRKTTGLIRGDILVNGHPKVQGPWSRVCGYVEQQDIHSAGTTVREALLFSARLRLTEDIGWAQVHQIVDDTLDMVDMTCLKDSIVGDPGSNGLSVEQRKRLSIGVELVANPSVVFMDEPTSGLDARAAAIVMRAVKNVSLSNRTVMVTIHQPSMEIFEAFDTLVLLQRGGRLTYFGPLGDESSMLIAYLEAQPGVEPIQPGYNPATWMLEVTGGSMSTTFKSSDHDFPMLYADSELRRQNEAKMERLAEEGKKRIEPLKLAGVYATSWDTQRSVLTKKFFKLYWRNPNYNVVRFMMTVVIGIVLGLVYMGQGDLDPDGTDVATVQNIMGLTFVLTIFLGMFNCMTVQPVMGAERTVFYRERSSSYYSPGPYAIASGVVEIPYLLVQSSLMVIIAYWMVGFQKVAWKFFYFWLMYFLSLLNFTFFGQFLVFITPNQLLAQLLGAFMNQLWTLFAGFLVPYPSMPTGWQWMNRISPTTWTLWGLAGSQLADRDVPMQGYNGPATVSQFVVDTFGYTFDMIWWCTLIIFAYCLFFRGMSTVMLKFMNFQRR